MNPRPPMKITLAIPCRTCGKVEVTLALLTSYGAYCRCEACGYVWHQEKGEHSERPRA